MSELKELDNQETKDLDKVMKQMAKNARAAEMNVLKLKAALRVAKKSMDSFTESYKAFNEIVGE